MCGGMTTTSRDMTSAAVRLTNGLMVAVFMERLLDSRAEGASCPRSLLPVV
jgi:hypothetical protein